MPKTYMVKDVADILGYSTNSIYTFLKEKRIKGVRVGKGRFRIPEEELTRILHLSKRPVEPVAAVAPSIPVGGAEPDTVPQVSLPPFRWKFTQKLIWKRANNTAVPNIYDWFIGIGAMISGMGLFLFNESNAVSDGLISAYLSTARIVLIAVGIGIVVCNVVEGLHTWRRIFYGFLTMVAIGSVWSFIRVFDYDGVVVYGAMGLLVFANMLFEIDGVISILWYLALLVTGMVTLLAVGVDVAHTAVILRMYAFPSVIAAALVAILAGGNVLVYWIGYTRRNIWLCVGGWITAIVAFAIAGWYGNIEYWSRAMYFIVLGFFTMLTPMWPRIAEEATTKHSRAMIHLFLARVSVMIFIAIFGIYEMQQVVWSQKQRVFRNKITIAERLLQHGFQTVTEMLTTTSLNPDFVAAVQKKDLGIINQYSRVLFDSHTYVRRIVVLDAEGTGLALYPFGTFDQKDLAFRDYFIAVRNSKKPYVSGVFEALADHSKRQVVSISVPLLDAKHNFVGVLLASVDLDQLNVELQQIADQENGETFTVVDQKGQYVFSENMSLVGTMPPANDPIRSSSAVTSSSVNMSVYGENLGITAYDVLPDLGWNIALRTSVGSVMSVNATAILALLTSIVVIMIAATWSFVHIHSRRPDSGGGPP